MRKLLALVLVASLTPACAGTTASNPPTPVAAVADVGTRFEQSADALLKQAQTLAQTPNTLKPGSMVLASDQLGAVAIAVDKAGRAGNVLKAGLDSYNAIKAAGGNTAQAAVAVQQAIADITAALNGIGTSIPSGTVQAIDSAVAAAFAIVAEAKAAVLQ